MNSTYKTLIQQFNASKSGMENQEPFYFDLELQEDSVYRNVCILGGGIAGYLTALAFRRFFQLPVTIIESSKIPPIGVGEATTPLMAEYLFGALGLDKKEFYEAVEPTWKLGIKFFWGKPGDYFFNYPFDSKDILSAYIHNNDINYCSLNSRLMSEDSSFVTRVEEDGELRYHSLSRTLKYAYHLDNQKFIGYLKQKSVEAGARLLDEEIKDAVLKDDGKEIDYLVNDQGDTFKFDMYVDCSGFRSLLLEKKLRSPYIPYKSSLYNDCAITATVPHGGKIQCYTYAESMHNGWCWNIPLRHENHRGYVFSSDFCSKEQAYEEMLMRNPTMSKDVNFIRFNSGRHQEFIKGNVVAIGNSYSFVEPLESTGVHMIIDQIIVLMNNFMNLKNKPRHISLLNRDMNDHWDYIRWFLSIHFKFNRKYNNSYWKSCRANVDTSGFDHFIGLYKELGLLTRQDTTVKNMIRNDVKDTIFDLFGIDHILFGQGILPNDIDRIRLENRDQWEKNVSMWQEILGYTIPLHEDLDVLLEHAHLM